MVKKAKGVKVFNLKPSKKNQKGQRFTPDPIKAEPHIRSHEVPFYDGLKVVMDHHRELIAEGRWDEQAWLDGLSEVFTEHFWGIAQSEVDRHITEDWNVLQRYGIERDVWHELFTNAMQQWVDGYVPELIALLRENNARLQAAGFPMERLADRVSGQARTERIAITEYTTVVGATQTMITMLFNEVMQEVHNGID